MYFIYKELSIKTHYKHRFILSYIYTERAQRVITTNNCKVRIPSFVDNTSPSYILGSLPIRIHFSSGAGAHF